MDRQAFLTLWTALIVIVSFYADNRASAYCSYRNGYKRIGMSWTRRCDTKRSKPLAFVQYEASRMESKRSANQSDDYACVAGFLKASKTRRICGKKNVEKLHNSFI